MLAIEIMFAELYSLCQTKEAFERELPYCLLIFEKFLYLRSFIEIHIYGV